MQCTYVRAQVVRLESPPRVDRAYVAVRDFVRCSPRNSRVLVAGSPFSALPARSCLWEARTTSSVCPTASLLSLCARPGLAIATGDGCGVSADLPDMRDTETIWWAHVLPDADVVGGPVWVCTSR